MQVGFLGTTRVTGGLHDLQTGHLTVKSFVEIGRRQAQQVFALDGLDGAGERSFLLRAVSHYDEFVQVLCVVFQRDYKVFLSGFDFDGLGFVSEE